MRHLITTAAALFALAGPASAQPIALTPAQIGEIFCISRLGNDMAPVAGLLTAGLAAAIAEAEAKDAAIRQQAPDEKPPLGDGIPWQSVPDYAASCAVGAVGTDATAAEVAIEYGFPEYPAGNFTDTLDLHLVEGEWPEQLVWRIDNLSHADGRDLRTVLISAFEPG